MYPNLLVPLVTIVLLLVAVLGYVAVFRPVARRLAVRQVARRRNEAILAVTGATLGIAIIVGALVVGDTLNHSVRQVAYRTLGPVDERIMAADPGTGELAAKTLQPLRSDPRVDGVLTVHVDQAAATTESSSGVLAEPRVLAWGLDYAQAAQFGRAGGSSGLDVAPPAAGDAIVNQPLANSLHLRAGEKFTLYLYGTAHTYRIARIVADRGLAGVGFGSARNHNVFLPPGALDLAAYKADTRPQTVSFVSNRGGVESGASLTTPVTARIDQLLTGLPVIVDTPKRVVLDDARKTGDALGALFLMIGSFSIIAGALLLVNIFTMLADERQSQLGMLRAIGMKRAQLVQSFTFEGATYAAAAVVPGIALGLGIGWAVALVSAQIFKSWSPDGNGLAISYAVTPTSIVNATCLGLVIALITIAAASVRISRFNVIAAIRDLPPSTLARTRKRRVIVATGFAVLFAVAAVPAVAASNGNLTLLLPALAIGLLIPALQRFLTPRAAITSAATAILAWSAVAPVLRPRMFDNPSMAIYVIQGSLIAFSGVAVISQNQHAIVRPLRRLIERPTERGLAMRLGVAYPLAKRFRTGATLIMYTLITLVLVLLIEITGVINKSIDTNVANATAGYALRLDVNPTATGATLADLRHGPFAADVAAVAPLVSAPALATDPGHRTSALLRAIAVGVPAGSMDAMTMTSRLPGLATDRQAWQLVQSDPKYVLLDQFFNATGGPNGKFYSPGDTLTLTNPRTGESAKRVIAGILSSALVFYPVTGNATNTYPVVSSDRAVTALFGSAAAVTSALVRLVPGTDAQRVAASMQGNYLAASLVATPIAANARGLFAANIAFFRLMQGFLALGLLIGITGLGVVMVRAVRERRRTIGVLRALGFQARTVQRSFLDEGAFVAAEGVLLGGVLGVLTTWLMYQKSAAFNGVRAGFPIEWTIIGVLCIATLLASLAATVGPARRAARILPAVAVRVAD